MRLKTHLLVPQLPLLDRTYNILDSGFADVITLSHYIKSLPFSIYLP